MELATQTLVKQ